jgi:hypothetical protein
MSLVSTKTEYNDAMKRNQNFVNIEPLDLASFFELDKTDVNDFDYTYEANVIRPRLIMTIVLLISKLKYDRFYTMTGPTGCHNGASILAQSKVFDTVKEFVDKILEEYNQGKTFYLYQILRVKIVDPLNFNTEFKYKVRYATN